MSDDEQTKPIPLPPSHEVQHRLDGAIFDPTLVPEDVVRTTIVQEETVDQIWARMLQRHCAAGLKVNDA
jgi:hypothetical protein